MSDDNMRRDLLELSRAMTDPAARAARERRPASGSRLWLFGLAAGIAFGLLLAALLLSPGNS
jgi:hypothetical protein